MAWRIEFAASAEKELRKLGSDNAGRILKFLRQRVLASKHPRVLGEPLHGPESGRFWKYRVGPYRVIAQIEDSALVIFIVRVGHRSKVYEKR